MSDVKENEDFFELSLDVTELRQRSLMVATPMYGGQCSGQFTKSVADLTRLGDHYGLDIHFSFLYNESLITRARNYLADGFMNSPYTHLMFIDSDIGFDPNDVITLLAIADPNSDKDIVCGPYPKKVISWEKIKRAVDKGFADQDPEQLGLYVGDYVFNPANGMTEIPIHRPVEVLEGGTGFMMCQKAAMFDFMKNYPHLMYRPDHVRVAEFDGTREIYAFFDALIDDKNANVVNELTEFFKEHPDAKPEQVLEFMKDKRNGLCVEEYSNRYLSEDYMFCQWMRRIGRKVWMCPWMKMTHFGTYAFQGSLADLAQVGVSATADAAVLGKEKKIQEVIDKTPKKSYRRSK